jgi:uncharacterized protein YceK
MVKGGLFITLAILAISVIPGCATCANYLGGEKEGVTKDQEAGKIYGGVLFLCQAVSASSPQPESHGNADEEPCWLLKTIALGMVAIDFPLSAVGDTLTLPYTISHTLACQNEARNQVNGKSLGPER